MIADSIGERNIVTDENQITVIRRLFLHTINSSSIRKGDSVLVLEIVQFVRNEYDAIRGLFDMDQVERSPTAQTAVGVLFTYGG